MGRNLNWPRRWAETTGVAWLTPDQPQVAREAFESRRERLRAACRRQGLSEVGDDLD